MQAAEQLEAAEERNNDDGGELHSAGTLAGMLILARTNGNHDKQAIQARPANWHDTPGQYIECTCKLTITKSIQDKHQHDIYTLSSN